MTMNPKTLQESLEAQYKEKFSELKDVLGSRVNDFLSEAVISNQFESPALKAEVELYRPIVEAMVTAFKASGILNSSSNEIPEEVKSVITEQTEVINQQDRKIKELRMRVKLHEMISNNLSGLNKDIIREAVTKFQGEEEMPDDELIKKLTHFVNNRKPETKQIQFESISSEIDEVNSILEGRTSNKGAFAPKTKISIAGLKKRVISESAGFKVPDEDESGELDPAAEFMRDFSHLTGS